MYVLVLFSSVYALYTFSFEDSDSYLLHFSSFYFSLHVMNSSLYNKHMFMYYFHNEKKIKS